MLICICPSALLHFQWDIFFKWFRFEKVKMVSLSFNQDLLSHALVEY